MTTWRQSRFVWLAVASTAISASAFAQEDPKPKVDPPQKQRKVERKAKADEKKEEARKAARVRALAANAEQYVSIFQQQFERHLESELRIVSNIVKLTDDQQKTIREAAKPVILEVAKVRSKDVQGPYGFRAMERLPEEVQGVLTEGLRGIASENQLTAYVVDVKQRNAFHQRVGVTGIMLYLDGALDLNPEQTEKCIAILTKNYHPTWGGIAMNVVFNNMSVMPPGMPVDDLAAILNDHQKAAFEAMKNADPQNAFRGIAVGPNVDAEAQERESLKVFEEDLQKCLDLRVANLTAQYELTPTQQKKFQLVIKGVKDTMTRKRRAAIRRYRTAFENRQVGVGIAVDPADMQYVQQSAGQLLTNNSRWGKMVERVLTADQREAYATLADARSSRYRHVMINTMATGMGQQMALSGKQLQSMADLLNDVMPEDISRFDYRIYAVMAEVPKERWVAAIGAKNWIMFKAQLDQAAIQFKQLEEARKKDSEGAGPDEDADADFE